MMQEGDIFNLMFRLRGGLARDQFGMLNQGLFAKALSGTKFVIERYHEMMAQALNMICDSETTKTKITVPIAGEEVTVIEEETIPTDAKLAFFNETRHSYGRTALL
jgi:TAG lipase/steryl ester hydrolase/phospholipase A2/LPA acyltransferase